MTQELINMYRDSSQKGWTERDDILTGEEQSEWEIKALREFSILTRNLFEKKNGDD